jgi:hypothetical protein
VDNQEDEDMVIQEHEHVNI